MPNRVFRPQHNPPYLTDHILAHPWGVILGGVLIVLNLMMFFDILAGLISPKWDIVGISPTVENLPALLGLTLSAMMIAGHTMIIRGITHNGKDLSVGWRIERGGTIIALAAWLAYAVSVMWFYPGSIYTWGLSIGISAALANRWIASVREEEAVRRAVCPHE